MQKYVKIMKKTTSDNRNVTGSFTFLTLLF